MDGTVLIADDDRTIRTVLTQALTRAGCKVHATSSMTTLLRWIAEGRGDAVVSDVVMPDGNGLELLPKIHADRPGLPVIIISAQNSVMTAIQANDARAFDYLPKPFDLADLLKATGRALEASAQNTAAGSAPQTSGHSAPSLASPSFAEADSAAEPGLAQLPLVGSSAIMQELYRHLAKLVKSDISVLVTGASGTGKSLVAQILHDMSDRAGKPLIRVLPEDLISTQSASELLAKTQDGTLVIEDVDRLSAEQQALLVYMLDTPGAHPPRFIATSQMSAQSLGDGQALRMDLFFRINGAALHIPALRDRSSDIDALSRYFLAQNGQNQPGPKSLSPEALDWCQHYPWPGNVRQLEHVLQHLHLVAQGDPISKDDVLRVLHGDGMRPAAPQDSTDRTAVTAVTWNEDRLSASVAGHLQRYFDLHGAELPPNGLYQRILREIETPLIEICLEATAGNQAKCAELLGINRNTLRKKITSLDIRVTRGRKMM